MSLKQTILDDIKSAMKAKDKALLSTLRMVSAGLKQVEIDERSELSDDRIYSIIEKMVKQRRDSVAQYDKAGRIDLKEQEEYEIQVLNQYLPEQMSDAEIEGILKQLAIETDAKNMQDMGKLMSLAKQKMAGRADMGKVSQHVKNLLQNGL